MFHLAGAIVSATVRSRLGIRMISSRKVLVDADKQWYASDEAARIGYLGCVNEEQWEGRGLDKTSVVKLKIKGVGVHQSADPEPHFTARAFNANDEAVWFFDTLTKSFYTCAIHFYPKGLPASIVKDRFQEVASNDPGLVAWCLKYGWDIKSGYKTN